MYQFIAVMFILLTAAWPSLASDKTTGLAITTSDFEHGDAAEKDMWNIVSQMPSVNHVYHADSTDAFLKRLARYQKAGYRLEHLVIAGHGIKDTPNISFDKGLMQASDLDVANLRDLAVRWQKVAKERKSKGKSYKDAEAKAKLFEARIKLFDRVSKVMAPKAQVLMINCSPAATEEGRKFVSALGNLLLGRNSGTIKASRSDVVLGQIKSLSDAMWIKYKTGKWLEIGDYFQYGDYEEFRIPKNRDMQGDAFSSCEKWKSYHTCLDQKRVCVRREQVKSCIKWEGEILTATCAEYKTYDVCAEWKWICVQHKVRMGCEKRTKP